MKHLNITRTLSVAVIAAAASMAASAATDGHLLKVTDIEIARQGAQGDKLLVSVTIDPRSVNPGRDREVVFTPQVISAAGGDTVNLAPIRVAGRNRYWSHVRNNDVEEGSKLYEAGSKELIEYRKVIDFEPWMEKCHIDMAERIGHCCDPIVPAGETPLAEIDYTRPPFEPSFRYVELTGDEAVEREAKGSAFIDFIVNRTEIRPWYRNNQVWLDSIDNTIRFVKNDPDAVITRVTIKGFASPEGPYPNNVRLAMGRTQALKEYVREQHSFDPAIMHTDYEPEDWEGLRRRMETLSIPHKAEIISIIDSNLEPDPKNSEIQRRYPKEYKFLLDSIYPALRHSDYTVNYRIRTFVDIEELKRVYASDPSKLRPIDFQRIAVTFPEGSTQRDDVFLTASKIYPMDPEAALNAANVYIKRGEPGLAAERLRYAGDTPEANFTRATLAGVNGDFDRSLDLFKTAAKADYQPADDEYKRVSDMINRTKVTYLITPTPAK